MPSSASEDALAACLDRFAVEIEQAAWEIVRAVLAAELADRIAAPRKPAPTAKPRAALPVRLASAPGIELATSAPAVAAAAAPAPKPAVLDEAAGEPAPSSGSTVSTGTVKWFNSTKGYGFIAGSDGTDVFVHQQAIMARGFRALAAGQHVKYVKQRGPRGPFASNVETLSR